MQKLLSVIILAIVCLSFAVPSSALVIKGRPHYCFDWGPGEEVGTNGVTEGIFWRSNCKTPSDNPNIFAFQLQYRPNAIGRANDKIPDNIYYIIIDVVVDFSTNKYNEYMYLYFDVNDKLVGKDSYLLNNDIDPSRWNPILPTSNLRKHLDKNPPICKPCK